MVNFSINAAYLAHTQRTEACDLPRLFTVVLQCSSRVDVISTLYNIVVIVALIYVEKHIFSLR